MTTHILPNLLSISHRYPAICLDAYGVFWNGNSLGLLPGSKEVMHKLVAEGKSVAIFSNSTQLASKEIEKLEKHGLRKDEHFHFLITSGQIAREIFLNHDLPIAIPRKKYWVFCSNHPKINPHHALFENTPFSETREIQEADFIYVGIPHIQGVDQTDLSPFKAAVASLKNCRLPMVCANPDRFAHEGNPPRAVVRQGSIAALYQEMGGDVFYIGKPSLHAYQTVEKLFKKHRGREILMVGDTPETDIQGAKRIGWDSALITKTGNMADRIAKHQDALSEIPESDRPTYFLKQMA